MTARTRSAEPGIATGSDVGAPLQADRRQADAILGPDEARVVMLAGGYGSGKTEVAVNLALLLARAGRRVQIADLDLVNPYFRCREARALMEAHGIRVVAPQGAQAWADLPIVLPEIAGMLDPPEGTVTLFDVGGDDVGARVLASLPWADAPREFWLVVNRHRPFNATVPACRRMRDEIEQASGQQATGLVANAHLVDETTVEVVRDGWELARQAAEDMGLPLRFVAAMEGVAEGAEALGMTGPVLRLERHMLPPWRRPDDGGTHG